MRTIASSLIALAIVAAPALADEHKGPVYEENVNRHGGTYSVEPVESAAACDALCGSDTLCRAWTYRVALSVTGTARCELKTSGGKREADPTAISGVSPILKDRYPTATPVSDSELEGAAVEPTPAKTVAEVEAPKPAPAPAPTVQKAPVKLRTTALPVPANGDQAISLPSLSMPTITYSLADRTEAAPRSLIRGVL